MEGSIGTSSKSSDECRFFFFAPGLFFRVDELEVEETPIPGTWDQSTFTPFDETYVSPRLEQQLVQLQMPWHLGHINSIASASNVMMFL